MEISQLPTAPSIDPINDLLPIVTTNINTTSSISRNSLLNLASQPVGISDTQTLTNKTFTSPTISSPTLSGTLSGTYTIGGTPTFPSSVTQNTATQTLTNKTLTSPTINSPTITNASLTADTITGYTTSNTGTIYGMSVTGGLLASAAIAGQVNTAALQTNAVGGSNLATSAITLGYAQITSSQTSTSSTTFQSIPGLSTTVTVPAGGRRVKITVYIADASPSGSGGVMYLGISKDGTQVQQTFYNTTGSANFPYPPVMYSETPTAGNHTYTALFAGDGTRTMTVEAGSGVGLNTPGPAFILVECI